MLSRWILEPVRSLSPPFLLLFNSFLRTANDLIAQRAVAIEKAVAEELGVNSGGYKAKIRSLFVNLKDKNNPSLREGVVSGDIPATKFSKMTSEVWVWYSVKALD